MLQNSHENTCVRVSFLIKEVQQRCFPVSFAKILKTPFFVEHLRWLLLGLNMLGLHRGVFRALSKHLGRTFLKKQFKFSQKTVSSTFKRVWIRFCHTKPDYLSENISIDDILNYNCLAASGSHGTRNVPELIVHMVLVQ